MTDLRPSPIDGLPAVGDAAVCMGVFDGVHRGHLALVEAAIRAARERGIRSVALVFEPHPDEIVRPGTIVPRLATLGENLRRLGTAGIDAPLAVQFDAVLRSRTPEDFLSAMAPAVRVRALVMTPESAFGRNRAGTPDAMRVHGALVGFDLVLAEAIVKDGGGAISSGRVREALRDGDLEAARRLLGHPPYLEATLGARSTSQTPLALAYPAALPAEGRYRVRVRARTPDAKESDEVLIVDDGDIGLASGSSNAAQGDMLQMDLLERTDWLDIVRKASGTERGVSGRMREFN